jgi:2',3'-cyclic-nucleotide 2'-phosphodiesterase (5'-nucleotidase family)
MKNTFFYLILLGLFSFSCTKSKPSNPFHEIVSIEKKNLSLVFSHNINGETHPCGCRHFPLGGLPQVAGKLAELKSKGSVILLDTGDMLFPSPNLPPTMKDSFTFGAENLAVGMDLIGLKYAIPGDQDLALGTPFLKKLLDKSKFQYLVMNFSDPKTLPHRRLVIIEHGDHKIFMTGLVDPDVITQKYNSLFISPGVALKAFIPELEKAGYSKANKKHRFILLSHSGMPNDQKLAKAFPFIDWVLGAHTQSFTKIPYEEKTTKLAQVLSRNHYLGSIEVNFSSDKNEDKWVLHEIRDELKDKLQPNIFTAFIKEHKEKVKVIQVQEQSQMANHTKGQIIKKATANSCVECHAPQVDFWTKTPHSIAYATLINANEDKNLTCIGCHSLGFSEVDGYAFPDELIHVDKETYQVEKTKDMKYSEQKDLEDIKLNKIKKKYWSEIASAFKGIDSIRELPKKKVQKLSKAWLKKDEKLGVSHNFANVQCMNCHDLHNEHPFSISSEITPQAKVDNMKEKCLNCHIPDQSPEWYEVQENGKPGAPKHELVKKMMHKLACPKNED